MKIIETYEFRLPTFLLCALINNDTSGLEEDDMEILKKANATFTKLANGRHWTISGWENSDNIKYFSWQPDFTTLGCDVVDIELNIFEPTTKECQHATGSMEVEHNDIVHSDYVKVWFKDICDSCGEVVGREVQTFKYIETEELPIKMEDE